nr:hypothetical protein [Tanacetum cinerariifolium]
MIEPSTETYDVLLEQCGSPIQGIAYGTDRYSIDNSRAKKSRVDELLSSLKRSLQYAYLIEGKAVDMSPDELLSMFTEMTGAREVETRKYIPVNKLNGMNIDLDEAERAVKEMLTRRNILRKEGKIYNGWNDYMLLLNI